MNWKNEAKAALRQLNAMRRGVEAIEEQIQTLEAEMVCVRSATADGTAVHGGGNTREDTMLNNIVKREELKRAQSIAESRIATIEASLNMLDETERLILDRFHINRQKGHVERLAEELFVEKSRIYILHDKALEKFTRAMYGALHT